MYQEEVNSKNLINLYFFFKLYSSVADPKRFDADPDPTFQANADPDPAPDPDPKLLELGRVKCFSSKTSFFSSP